MKKSTLYQLKAKKIKKGYFYNLINKKNTFCLSLTKSMDFFERKNTVKKHKLCYI